MALDPQLAVLIAAADEMPAGPKLWELPIGDARTLARAMTATLDLPEVPVGHVEDRRIQGPGGDLAARVYTPVEDRGDPLPVLLYFHGGAWALCDLDTHDILCRSLANKGGCKVVSVEYRLAPEHVCPAAVEDAQAAVRWVVEASGEIGVDPARIAVGGDSAGGNIAAVLCQRARAAGASPIRFQLLIYPVTDTDLTTASYTAFARGYFLERGAMRHFIDLYRGGLDRADPLVAPLRAASFEGLPPAYIVTAGYDVLRDEGRAYADALRAAGVPIEHVEYAGMIHGFCSMQGALDVAREAVDAAGRALRRAFAGPPAI